MHPIRLTEFESEKVELEVELVLAWTEDLALMNPLKLTEQNHMYT